MCHRVDSDAIRKKEYYERNPTEQPEHGSRPTTGTDRITNIMARIEKKIPRMTKQEKKEWEEKERKRKYEAEVDRVRFGAATEMEPANYL